MKPKSNLRRFLALAGSSLLAMSSSHAATRNWDGDQNVTWATPGNWDTAPANSLTTDIANFNLADYDGSTVYAPTVGTATSINGITIGALNGAMTLTNTAALSIGGSGIAIANGAGAFTISGTTTLGAAQNWTNNSGNLFSFGAVTNAANLLTIGGTGNTTASGVIGNGAGGLTKEGAGILNLNAANTYTGTTTVNGGELRWGITDAIAGNLTVNNGGTVNMQGFTDTVSLVTIAKGGAITGTTSGTLTVTNITSDNGGTISGLSGGIVGSATTTVTYNDTIVGSTTFNIDKLDIRGGTTFAIARGDDVSGVDFDITGVIISNNNGRNIIKSGSGVMRLSGSIASNNLANSTMSIQDGTLIFNKSTDGLLAYGGTGLFTIGDNSGSAASAVLRYETSSNQIADNAITINSDGRFDLNGKSETTSGAVINNGSITTGVGTLTLGNAANTFSGASTATGNLTFSGNAATNLTLGGTASINGTTTFSGTAGAGITATGSTSIAGTLAFGSNGRTIAVNTGSDTLTITANITGNGALTKTGAGTLQIGDGTTAGTMSSTSALTMGGGTLAILAPTTGSSSQTVASLATTASTDSTIRITPGSSGNTTLTITSGTLSTGAGSSLNFDYTAGTTVGGTVGNNYVVWNPTLTGGIIGGAYTVTDSGGTGFATRNGANVVRLTDPGSAGLPDTGGSATGSYFVGSGYSPTFVTTESGSLVLALSGAVAASNVTVDTTGKASGANLALGTNLLTLGAGMVFNGANPYEISGSGAGGLSAAAAGGTINLYNANTNTVTISAPIVNNTASRLTVDGPGTTILSGTNTYTGATVVNGGTVRFSGTMAASPITINNNAVAQLGTATGLTSINTVTFGAGSTGSLQLLGNHLTIGALNSALGTPVITNNNGGPSVGNATLTINSALASTFGGVIQDGPGGGSLALTNSGAGTLNLAGGINTYTGGTTINAGVVSITTDANLGDAGGGITLNGGRLNGGGNNISTARIITVTGTGSSINVNRNCSFTTSGKLTGAGGLTLVGAPPSGGASAYNFNSTANDFTGALIMTSAVALSVNSFVDGAGNIVSNPDANGSGVFSYGASAVAGMSLNTRAFEINSAVNGQGATIQNNNTTHAITIGSNLVATGAGAKVLTLGAVAGPTNVFGGSITDGSGGGTVGITTSGAGTWLLSGANTYTGTTTIGGGTLMINTLTSGNIIMPKLAVGNLIYMGSGDTTNGTIRLEDDVSSRNSGSGIYNNGTGALIFNGGTFNTPFVSSGNTGHTTTLILGGTFAGSANEVRGVIANNDATTSLFAITKNGSGTWALGGSNTYTGATTLNAGTLKLNYDTGTFGTNTSKLANTNGILALNGGTLELAGGSHTEVVTSTTLNNGTTFIKQTGGGSSTLSMGVITYTGGALDFSAAGIANVSTSAVTNGILSSAAGTARVTVGGADWAAKDVSNNVIAYTGYTSFTGGATSANINYSSVGDVTLGANRGATSNTIKITTSGSGQSMKLNNNFNLTLGSLLFAGADNYSIAAESGTGRIDSAFLLHNYGAGTLTLGATNGAITQFGTGTTILSGNNAADVGINIFGGTVQFSNNLQIGTNAAARVISLNNGTLRANTAGTIALNSSGNFSRTVSLGAGGGTLDITGGGTLTVSGAISSATASQFPTLTIGSASSSGTIELTAANTYTGLTSVTGGKLLVNNTTGSGTGTGTVNVGALGTLGGSGTITGAVNITGQISAGNSIETLGTGTLSLLDGSTLVHELDSSVSTALGSDLLKVTGDLNFTGTVNLSLTDLALTDVAFAVNNIFSLINYTGAWNNGLLTYSGNELADEEVFSFGLNTWRISYNDATGGLNYTGEYAGGADSFVNLTAVTIIPEPGAAFIGSLGLLALLRRRR